jgi:hypothetical protein
MQRRALLFGLGASASVTPVFQASAPRSLRAVAAERNIRFGSELTCADLDADPADGPYRRICRKKWSDAAHA